MKNVLEYIHRPGLGVGSTGAFEHLQEDVARIVDPPAPDDLELNGLPEQDDGVLSRNAVSGEEILDRRPEA